jgi:hypothetical protein
MVARVCVQRCYIQNKFNFLTCEGANINIDLGVLLIVEFSDCPKVCYGVRSILIADSQEGRTRNGICLATCNGAEVISRLHQIFRVYALDGSI